MVFLRNYFTKLAEGFSRRASSFLNYFFISQGEISHEQRERRQKSLLEIRAEDMLRQAREREWNSEALISRLKNLDWLITSTSLTKGIDDKGRKKSSLYGIPARGVTPRQLYQALLMGNLWSSGTYSY